jgi:hypothetical protein
MVQTWFGCIGGRRSGLPSAKVGMRSQNRATLKLEKGGKEVHKCMEASPPYDQ